MNQPRCSSPGHLPKAPAPGRNRLPLYLSRALILLFAGFYLTPMAQVQPDTLKPVQKKASGNRKEGNGITDSAAYHSRARQIYRSRDFYGRLERRSDTSYFLKNLYPLLFRKPPSGPSEAIINLSSNLPFTDEKGKIIRNIHIRKLPVFGSSVYDSMPGNETRMQRTLNKTHFYSRDAVIRRYLLIEKGDALDPVALADNERVIRDASIFQDARFLVSATPGNDSVDIVLLVKDVFPFGFDLKVNEPERSRLRFYNRNFLGLGHQPEQWLDIDLKGSPVIILSQGAYRVRNIRSSFTDAYAYWQSNRLRKGIGFEISRPFITPETRFGGGLKTEKFDTPYPLNNEDFVKSAGYALIDVWGGYASIIERPPGASAERLQAAVTGRYYDLRYSGLPATIDSGAVALRSVQRVAGEICLIRSGFYLNNMVYGFGRTEDIPTGYHAGLILGYEHSVLAKAPYAALRFSSGTKLNGAGYLFSSFYLGGYRDKGKFSDGLANISFSFISGLVRAGTYRFRHFVTADLFSGISRTSPLTLSLNRNEITDTYRKYELSGLHRATARYEIVAFTPWYLLGFRFAGYASGELGLISPDMKHLLKQAVFPAIGAGIRIRNENLVFSTFQISLVWHPRPINGSRGWIFELEEPDQAGFNRFGISPPDFMEFR